MANTFNRNDGTFAAIGAGDVGGTGFTTTHAVLLSETTGFGYAVPTTSGFVLTDNGVGNDPSFKAVGNSFTTTHAVLLSETAGAFGYANPQTLGFVLTDNGAGVDPTFQQGVAGITGGGTPTAGNIGELVDSGAASGVSTTNAAITNITSVAVTAGEWDLFGYVSISPSTASQSGNYGFSTANNSFTGFQQLTYGFSIGGSRFAVGTFPARASGNTTYFVNGQANFTSGTCTLGARIWARRAG